MSYNTEAANLALSHLGIGKTVSDLETEQSAEAKVVRAFYNIVLKMVLRDYPWPFATKISTLGLIEEDPNTEWGYSYQYPSDCEYARRILGVSRNESNEERVPYKIFNSETGRLIYTDVENAELEYTMTIDDFTVMPADFIMAFSFKLAYYIAPQITAGDPMKVGERARVNYELELSNAKSAAFNEEQQDVPPESELVRMRV